MLKLNVESDFKAMLKESGMTQLALAEKVGTSPQYVNRLLKQNKNLVNGVIVKMADALGYDVEIKFVKTV